MLNIRTLWVKPVVNEIALLAAILGGLAWLSYISGADAALARALYNPTSPWAWFAREYGALSMGIVAWFCLLGMFWPRLATNNPALYRSAAIIVLTAVFGAGLLNQVMIKDLADRPRPRDVVLADTPNISTAELKGNSMPSGHAGMAFVLMAPFFTLRPRHNRAAMGFFMAGAVLGSAVGVARMVSGAHFLSDVLVAALITLITARLAAALLAKYPVIPKKSLLAIVLLVCMAFVLGNKFTLTLRHEAVQPWHTVNLPCTLMAIPTPNIAHPVVELTLQGYGAPLSQLQLINSHGTLRLRREYGLYHSLTCTGQVLVPESY